ncbi:hypothetical protein [Streptomyces sp. NPDC057740]|uniref:hypothetical protein n=1 Tax=Streptomyces sp. NPDC057740 TaxID=3346234 RepID=UPI003692A821
MNSSLWRAADRVRSARGVRRRYGAVRRGAGEGEEVAAFVVETQGVGDGGQDGFGEVRVAALLQAGVVGGDTRQGRDLLTAWAPRPEAVRRCLG